MAFSSAVLLLSLLLPSSLATVSVSGVIFNFCDQLSRGSARAFSPFDVCSEIGDNKVFAHQSPTNRSISVRVGATACDGDKAWAQTFYVEPSQFGEKCAGSASIAAEPAYVVRAVEVAVFSSCAGAAHADIVTRPGDEKTRAKYGFDVLGVASRRNVIVCEQNSGDMFRCIALSADQCYQWNKEELRFRVLDTVVTTRGATTRTTHPPQTPPPTTTKPRHRSGTTTKTKPPQTAGSGYAYDTADYYESSYEPQPTPKPRHRSSNAPKARPPKESTQKHHSSNPTVLIIGIACFVVMLVAAVVFFYIHQKKTAHLRGSPLIRL